MTFSVLITCSSCVDNFVIVQILLKAFNIVQILNSKQNFSLVPYGLIAEESFNTNWLSNVLKAHIGL